MLHREFILFFLAFQSRREWWHKMSGPSKRPRKIAGLTVDNDSDEPRVSSKVSSV
jgi:hypothetical protein